MTNSSFCPAMVARRASFPRRDFEKRAGGVQRFECGNKKTNRPKGWLVSREPVW
jgi:hypothetical protein